MRRSVLIAIAAGFGFVSGAAASEPPSLLALAGEHLLLEARDGRVAAYSTSDMGKLWTARGVATPTALVVSEDGARAAVLDAISDRVAVVDVESGEGTVSDVPPTPVAAAFLGESLFVISRDGRTITRFGADGSSTAAPVPRDAFLIHATARAVFVYGRASGEGLLLDPDDLSEMAAASLPPFASDLEADGSTGYLVLPRSSKIVSFSLETLAVLDERSAGAVPTDLVRAKEGTIATASTIAIADPSSKRIWRDEGSQSVAAAFGRGFLRGLLGLGLFTPRSSELPTGVDRVFVANGALWAFDTSSGSLYRTSGSTVTRVAQGLRWGSFAVGRHVVFAGTDRGIERVSAR